ncbi:MoaD/ThiS family protein [Synechocystis salina LEGE 06155]|uniref:MoaD/ThiS family protein n=1 Tax=unclassified Synechocystis TaxID=2640012 RepID=UPI0019EFF2C2|nr:MULTISPECIES: MoaD/ThiS family protein [unclassified Synechocystis]MBE9174640.1 MoaD/ThiS family protein [Synechocystis salina LEGE 06155]QUS60862.1 MoaD/ThiS family protein [Synechocystis sp. PCC 7338]UAJ73049.1 MoaD/ThiS family protein [Synechocystis sp. PCC 7339]
MVSPALPRLSNPLFFANIMTVKVLIPTPLQKFTSGQATIDCEAADVGQLIEALEASCPGIKARLCDEEGKPRRFLNFYVNEEDIRFLEGTDTALSAGDEVSIVPAVAGG